MSANYCQQSHECGYDYEFISEPSILQEYICFICRCVARNPQQVNCCGKMVCSTCLERWRKARSGPKKCPHCKQELQAFHDKNCHQKIISLKVRCSYTVHGCDWVGELKVFEEHHYHSCHYQVKPCPECGEQLLQQDFKRHTMHECKMRKVKCPHCPCFETYQFVYEEHKPVCKYWPVECPSGCGQNIVRSQIEQHRETCRLQLVQCRYFENGCQVMVARMEMEAHERDCPKKLTGETSRLTRSQQQTIEGNEKGTVAPITVQFKDFNEHKNNTKVWESQPFYCFNEGFRICLIVHPNGCLSGQGEYLSCYIHLLSGHFDDKQTWPFQGIVTISLINQAEDDNHFKKQCKFLTCNCKHYNTKPEKEKLNPFGIGDPQFIKHNELEGNGTTIQYLKDDRLLFNIRYDTIPKQQPYNPFVYHTQPFPY